MFLALNSLKYIRDSTYRRSSASVEDHLKQEQRCREFTRQYEQSRAPTSTSASQTASQDTPSAATQQEPPPLPPRPSIDSTSTDQAKSPPSTSQPHQAESHPSPSDPQPPPLPPRPATHPHPAPSTFPPPPRRETPQAPPLTPSERVKLFFTHSTSQTHHLPSCPTKAHDLTIHGEYHDEYETNNSLSLESILSVLTELGNESSKGVKYLRHDHKSTASPTTSTSPTNTISPNAVHDQDKDDDAEGIELHRMLSHEAETHAKDADGHVWSKEDGERAELEEMQHRDDPDASKHVDLDNKGSSDGLGEDVPANVSLSSYGRSQLQKYISWCNDGNEIPV